MKELNKNIQYLILVIEVVGMGGGVEIKKKMGKKVGMAVNCIACTPKELSAHALTLIRFVVENFLPKIYCIFQAKPTLKI